MEATVILIKLTEQKFSVLFSYNLAVHLLLFWRIYFNWKVAALEFQWGSNPVSLTHISLVFERHSYKKKFTKLCAKYIEHCQWNTQIVCVRKWKELIRGAFEPSGTLRGIAHLVISTTFGPGAGKCPSRKCFIWKVNGSNGSYPTVSLLRYCDRTSGQKNSIHKLELETTN